MSHKSAKIAALIEHGNQNGLDAHYIGYFQCFNSQRFYEAHDVLEELWLPQRHAPNGNFYKGLIQLAGAFVHLQKKRPGPGAALFKLAQSNLRQYPAVHESLDILKVLSLVGYWLNKLEGWDPTIDALTTINAPALKLLAGSPSEQPSS
jgi:predicted metal-dependent hydrolase